ncbi:unnamed protein product [Merluccius merluccius]
MDTDHQPTTPCILNVRDMNTHTLHRADDAQTPPCFARDEDILAGSSISESSWTCTCLQTATGLAQTTNSLAQTTTDLDQNTTLAQTTTGLA